MQMQFMSLIRIGIARRRLWRRLCISWFFGGFLSFIFVRQMFVSITMYIIIIEYILYIYIYIHIYTCIFIYKHIYIQDQSGTVSVSFLESSSTQLRSNEDLNGPECSNYYCSSGHIISLVAILHNQKSAQLNKVKKHYIRSICGQ